jgi:hypothetical protein
MEPENLSAEDRYAAAVELLEGKEATPVEAEKPEATPAPVEAGNAAETRTRNPDGTFAPKGETATPAAERLPFEGFDKLDPAAQEHFKRLLSERDDARLKYTRQNGEYKRLQQSGSGRQPQPGRQNGSGNTQPATNAGQQAGLADARQLVAGSNATGAEKQAMQAQLDKWEDHKTKWPEDAAAIEQRIRKFQDDLEAGFNPLVQEVNEMRETIAQLRDGYTQIQEERAVAHKLRAVEEISKIAGDNFSQIAGFEDDYGNPIHVPEAERRWHPEFVAWINGHDPDIAQDLWERLRKPSVRVVGEIVRAFNEESFALDNQQAPVATRRETALRDVTPIGGGKAKPSPSTWMPTGQSPEDQFAATVEAMAQLKR